MKAGSTLLYLADSILYLSSMLRDQPRRIDRYIDYFGDWPAGAVPAVVRSPRPARIPAPPPPPASVGGGAPWSRPFRFVCRRPSRRPPRGAFGGRPAGS